MKELSPEKRKMQDRVDVLDRLLLRLNSDDHTDRLRRERRSLLRIIHDIPQQVQLPLDWKP